MLYYDFLGSTKPIANAAAQTLVWSGNDLPGTGLAYLWVTFAAAGNILSDIDRLVLKADSTEIVNLTRAQLQNFELQTSFANSTPATTLQAIGIPLMDLLEDNLLAAESQQFPRNATPQLEVVMNTGAATGTARVAWALSDQKPNRFPKMISRAHGLGVTINNGRMPFTTEGVFRGFSAPIVGLKRMRCMHNGVQVLHLPGLAYDTAIGDLFAETARFRGGVTLAAGAAGTDPVWHFLETSAPASSGRSYFEMDLDTATAGGEIAVYEVIPQ